MNPHEARLSWPALAVDLSYCVVNTNGREYLLACLAAIEATHPAGVEREILVLDNASTDGSADAVRALGGEIELIEQPRRTGKAANDSLLMERAQGRYCLLLNEDSELRPGRPRGPDRRARRRPEGRRRDAAAARLATARPTPAPGASPASARRSPGRSSCTAGSPCRAPATRPAGSTGRSRAPCWSAARRPPRSATWTPTSSSTTTSATSPGGSPTPAGTSSSSPPPRPSTTTSSPPTSPPGLPRIVEFHRNRDLYMRKHHGAAAALAVRVLTAWSYGAAGARRDRHPRPARGRLPRPRAAGTLPGARRRAAGAGRSRAG